MRPAALIFSLLTMAAAGFLIWRAWDIRPQRLQNHWDRNGLEVPATGFHDPSPLVRRDLLPMLAITLAYAAVAFWGLGDRDTPQSWHYFPQAGDQVILELDGEAEVGKVLYFTGPDAGKYRLDASTDGQNWTWLGELDQTYAQVLRW